MQKSQVAAGGAEGGGDEGVCAGDAGGFDGGGDDGES